MGLILKKQIGGYLVEMYTLTTNIVICGEPPQETLSLNSCCSSFDQGKVRGNPAVQMAAQHKL
ncbi:hypothetical protein QQP08_016502 [Theobroma cacao]|nr:hypothetical protein QQP08_016502 [Theobroma cacao]